MLATTFTSLAIALAACDGGDAGPSNAGAASSPSPSIEGEALYANQCLVCHQADGGGVPRLQPPLDGSEVVLGDPDPLIENALRGVGPTDASLEPSGEYMSSMPSFARLSDEELAALLTYVRTAWGNDAEPISPDRVAAVRERVGTE